MLHGKHGKDTLTEPLALHRWRQDFLHATSRRKTIVKFMCDKLPRLMVISVGKFLKAEEDAYEELTEQSS